MLNPEDFSKSPPPPEIPVIPKLKEPDIIPLSLIEALAECTHPLMDTIPFSAAAAAALQMNSIPLLFADDTVNVPFVPPIIQQIDLSIYL